MGMACGSCAFNDIARTTLDHSKQLGSERRGGLPVSVAYHVRSIQTQLCMHIIAHAVLMSPLMSSLITATTVICCHLTSVLLISLILNVIHLPSIFQFV